MYGNGKYNRYGLFANTISAGVAPFLMGLLSVCSNFLKIIRKKCAENLVVCDIRINTHTHTHTHTLLSRVKVQIIS